MKGGRIVDRSKLSDKPLFSRTAAAPTDAGVRIGVAQSRADAASVRQRIVQKEGP